MSIATAKDLLESIAAFNKVKNGDSGDAEHDTGVELADAAHLHLIDESARSIELAELVDSYGDVDVDSDDAEA